MDHNFAYKTAENDVAFRNYPVNFSVKFRASAKCNLCSKHRTIFTASVCPSVCDVQVCWSRRLEYFEN